MQRRTLLLALLLVVFATSGHAAQKFWTRKTVSTLTLDLVDDPTIEERLMFGPKFVLITRVTWGRIVGDEREFVTTQPALHWRFRSDRVEIYHPGYPRDPDETLTFVRREGSFLVLRRKSGAIARFRMQTKV